MEKEAYESFEIPGVGELRARQGTSNFELAGAVKYWHDRYQTEVASVRLASFTGGVVFTTLIGVISYAIYWLW